jgi:hypothetical protein
MIEIQPVNESYARCDERRGVFFEQAPYETDLHRSCLEEKCQRLYADYRGQVISIVAGCNFVDSSDLFLAAAIRHGTFMRLKRFEHQEETKVSRA